tara:strand:+ start:8617 stop:9546 length:930 start_codon:yes stop_codon:yes gene_type:complete
MSAEVVIRAIKYQSGAEVIGCDMHPREWIAASRLVTRFYRVPPSVSETVYISRVLEICQLEDIDFLIPLTDPEVDVLSLNRQVFNDAGVTICISAQAAICAARDKLAVYQSFYNHPRIRVIPTADLQERGSLDFSFPMLAKPRCGRSSEGHVIIPDAASLQFWRERFSLQDYIIQPRYSGDVFVVDIVRSLDGSRVATMTRQELVRTANGAGITVRMWPKHVCDALAMEVADILGLSGCANVEFLVVDGLPLLMDVNPRFSAGVVFSIISGYNMAANHIRCFNGGFVELCPPPPEKVYTRGFVEYSLKD